MGRNKELANPEELTKGMVSSSSKVSCSSRVSSSVILSSAGFVTKPSSSFILFQSFLSPPTAPAGSSGVAGGRHVSSIESRVPEKLAELGWSEPPELRAAMSLLVTLLRSEASSLPPGWSESKSFFWLVFSSFFLLALEPFRGVFLL